MTLEFVPAVRELTADFPVVVDFAVKDEGDIPRLVREGLVAGLEVNDAQAPDSQGQVRKLELAVAIGAAMLEPGGHLIDSLPTGYGLELQIQKTTNAAHGKEGFRIQESGVRSQNRKTVAAGRRCEAQHHVLFLA
jgi:hypothetical protein